MLKRRVALHVASITALLSASLLSASAQHENGAPPHQPSRVESENYWNSQRLVQTETRALNFIEFFVEADLPLLLMFLGLFSGTIAFAFSFPQLITYTLGVAGVGERVSRGVAILFFLAILGVGGAVSLSIFDLDVRNIVLTLNLIGIALSYGWGTQISNVMSGIVLPTTSRVQVGDLIEIGGASGEVQEIGIYNTYLKSPLKNSTGVVVGYDQIEIPNHYFSQYHVRRFFASTEPTPPQTIAAEQRWNINVSAIAGRIQNKNE